MPLPALIGEGGAVAVPRSAPLQSSVGAPQLAPPTAKFLTYACRFCFSRRDGRVAEGARLESVFTFTGNVGSNPTLSAILFCRDQNPGGRSPMTPNAFSSASPARAKVPSSYRRPIKVTP